MGSRLRAVDIAGIERITEDYRRAATLAVEAGFDSIEVHVGHNYLLSAFLSPKLNRRDDQFGGSVENRARFARTVLRTVRDAVGPGHGGHGQAQHGRRRGRRPVARRERRDRHALRGRRRARCAGAHRGQLARQPDVPLPGRRAAAGVRRHPAAGRPARLPRRRPPLPASPTPTRRPSSSPSRASSCARCPPRSSSSAASRSWRRSSRRWPRASRSSPWPAPCCASPTCPNRMQAGTSTAVAVHPLQQVHAHHLLGHALRPGDVLGGRPPRFRLGRDRRPARRPRRRLLELAGQREQRLLVAEAADELHADRQPVVVPVQRQRDRRAGPSR